MTRRRERDRDRAAAVPGRSDVLGLASLLLRYPDEWLTARAGDLLDTARALPPSQPALMLTRFAEHFAALAAAEPDGLRRDYVETFDMRRKTSLHLTYFLHGDTRRRGMALVTLARQLRAGGMAVADGELPDHLPALLEFAAMQGCERGESPLRRHRAGIELIYQALRQSGSAYADVLDAVRSVIGELGPRGHEQVAALLAAGGAPNEDVGLEPYGMPPLGSLMEPAWHPSLDPADDAPTASLQGGQP